MSSPLVRVLFACVTLVFGLALAMPAQNQQPQLQEEQDDESAFASYGMALWSVVEDCFSEISESTTVCFKSKAMTALDRALSKPTITLMNGITLSARSGKSLIDSHAEQADRAALDAVKDLDQKNALLDDMLATRVERFMSSRSIVMESPEEGRGKTKTKDKGDKTMKQTMMMAGMAMAAVMGPMAMKMMGMMAMKALLLSKIALALSGIMVLKKLMNKNQKHEPEIIMTHSSWDRSMKHVNSAATSATAQKMAYSAQPKK